MSAPEAVTIVAGRGAEGEPVFAVLVKRSFAIRDGAPLEQLEEAEPFLRTDLYHPPGDPQWCSLAREEECAPVKRATDIVILADAHAPEGQPAPVVVVGVDLGGRRKLLRVSGERVARHRPGRAPVFTDPEPFTAMPIRYERAYGGIDDRSDPAMPLHYPRNPLGRGVAVRNERHVIEGLPLPNIEDPDDLLTPERLCMGEPRRWNAQPLPHGLAWMHKTWYPRCSFVGAMPPHVDADTMMREEALGLVPPGQIALARQFRLPSYDVRFNSAGSLGMVLPDAPRGMTIRLARLTPEPLLTLSLPLAWPEIGLDIGRGTQALRTQLHTVLLDIPARRAHLVWGGALAYPGPAWLPQMTRLHAEVH